MITSQTKIVPRQVISIEIDLLNGNGYSFLKSNKIKKKMVESLFQTIIKNAQT